MARVSRFVLPLVFALIFVWILQSHGSKFGRGGSMFNPPAAASPPAPSSPEEEASFRIFLGLTDTESTRWDGSLSLAPGKIVRLEPWRFDEGDSLQEKSWKISTHRARAFGGGQQQQQPQRQERQQQRRERQQKTPTPPSSAQPQPPAAESKPRQTAAGTKTSSSAEAQASSAAASQNPTAPQPQPGQPPPNPPPPFVANGIVATFKNLTPASQVEVKTARGNFTFRPADLPYGKSIKFLDGRAMVDRVPAAAQITRSRDEQDFPAAAVDREGNIWVAYLQFTVNPKFRGIRMALKEAPKNFAELAEPASGDQVFLVRYSRGSWSDPIAVSAPHGDLFRPAVAIDGAGAVWTFWSANAEGNFDLYARSYQAGRMGETLRLSSAPGSDIAPVAVADSQGRVWVAWQAFRNGRSQIHASRQQGQSFSEEIMVASSTSNEWNPAIAASSAGQVTIAWDSYRAGNYDVYFRNFGPDGGPGPEKAAAATARYEAYPSITYDPSGRLWMAWEETDAGWGKDFGAYETTGIGLYQGRWVRVKVFQGDQVYGVANLDAVLPGAPDRKVDATVRQSESQTGKQPDTALAKDRKPSRVPQPPSLPANNYPRILADRGGRIWLAYRTANPIWWTGLGTVWFENLVAFDGSGWTNPIFIPHSDNLLDNRPALVSSGSGELMIVRSADGRQQFHAKLRGFDIPGQQFAVEDDPYNNDLYASRVVLSDPVKPAKLEAASSSGSASRPAGTAEAAAVSRLRDYRARIRDVEYRIMRGEFHRHTEISMDGGRDGSIWDAWRYAIDAASLDWVGCCDHDNGFGREYSWWQTQKLTDLFLLPGVFTPMFNYERSVAYPEGHRNVIFAKRGVRTLPRLPKVKEETPGNAPDTQMLYGYLRRFDGIVASHTSATNMGTDWRDNDPSLEPVVEIYQGDRQNYEMPDAPRSNNEKDSIGGWRPKGFVSLALEKGYRLGFQSSSDHISTHMSYCNLYTTAATRGAVLESFKKRHVYGATDDILADVRSGEHMMGDQFDSAQLPKLAVKLIGTAPFAKVHVIKDNKYAYTTEPKSANVDFTWVDTAAQPGKTSYYYVRGEQQDGELVWVSPMWITYRGGNNGR